MPYVWMGEYKGDTFYVDKYNEVYNYYGDLEPHLSKGNLANLRRCN